MTRKNPDPERAARRAALIAETVIETCAACLGHDPTCDTCDGTGKVRRRLSRAEVAARRAVPVTLPEPRKRPTLAEAVTLIALNDAPGDSGALDPREVRRSVTVGIVADLFGVSQDTVARRVVAWRRAHGDE